MMHSAYGSIRNGPKPTNNHPQSLHTVYSGSTVWSLLLKFSLSLLSEEVYFEKFKTCQKRKIEENAECNTVDLMLWEACPIKVFQGAINNIFTGPEAPNDPNRSAGG